jgi:hypothetical protein
MAGRTAEFRSVVSLRSIYSYINGWIPYFDILRFLVRYSIFHYSAIADMHDLTLKPMFN